MVGEEVVIAHACSLSNMEAERATMRESEEPISRGWVVLTARNDEGVTDDNLGDHMVNHRHLIFSSLQLRSCAPVPQGFM